MIRVLQEVLIILIEILCLYLILSNINGKNLKQSLSDLFLNPQRILWENIIIMTVYVVVMSFIIYHHYSLGHFLSFIFLPFMAMILFKKLNLKQSFLSYLWYKVLVMIFGVFIFATSIHHMISFIMLIVFILFNMKIFSFYKLYEYMSRNKRILFLLNIISLLIYITIIFIGELSARTFLIFTFSYIFFVCYMNMQNRKETQKIIKLIRNQSYDNISGLIK